MTSTVLASSKSAAWMHRADVLAVVKALGAPDVDVRFVGGCVRDSILNRPVSDIDLATPDLPDIVTEKALDAGLKAVPTGLSHGTVTVVSQGTGFEVTTLRRDTATDGRHAEVAYTTDWQEDASRRDFTFNAMSLRSNGTLFDYFGGEADALAGRVRFIGEARDRIREDYLRILRYFRFLALYGKEAPSPQTLEACRELRAGLDALSIERIRDEVMKLLNAPNPMTAIDAMKHTGIWDQVFPEASETDVLRSLLEVEGIAGVKLAEPAWRRRFAALMPNADQAVECVGARLRLSNKDVRCLAQVHEAASNAAGVHSKESKNHFFHTYEPLILLMAVLLGWARSSARDKGVKEQAWETFYKEALSWTPKVFPLSGKDAKSLGLAEGPKIGALLEQLEQQWVEEGFTASKAELQQRLRDRVSQKKRPHPGERAGPMTEQ